VDLSVFEEFLTNLYARDDNLILISFALGVGVWALSGMLIALYPNRLSIHWWTAVAAIAISGTYMIGKLAIEFAGISEALLDISETLIVVSLSWVSAQTYRRIFPHLGAGITQSLLNAHQEHFEPDDDDNDRDTLQD